MPATPTKDTDLLDLKRRAYLLERLSEAAGGKLAESKAKTIPKQAEKELTLTKEAVEALHLALASHGLIVFAKRNCWITEDGRKWLAEHRDSVPVFPKKREPKPKGEPKAKREPAQKVKPTPPVVVEVPIHESRDAFVLLSVFDCPDGGRTPKDLFKKSKTSPPTLGLNEATTNQVLDDLIARRFVLAHRVPRSIKHTITPAGEAHLLTLSFEGLGILSLTGPALTRLLRASRGDELSRAVESDAQTVAPTTARLEESVMEIFAELRRERHANTGLVPIHEVRSGIRQRHGNAAASHEVLDEVLKGLRRSKRLGLLSISDRSRATPEQLHDSIVGVGETFFYLELVDGSTSS